MKPIRLIVNAFGPYADQQVLDFRELNNRSLFLITGPTGAGKTSILDAICFALYGDTSGAERKGKRMRSDHSDPFVQTEVTFDFSLGKKIFRVWRKPEQSRPKLKGEDFTTTPSAATLWERTGLSDDNKEGEVLGTKWSTVTDKIEELLGFRSDQFRQVVILPQGKFRDLLLASSGERQKILETLFQTEIYRKIEEALKEETKSLESRITELKLRFQAICQMAQVKSDEELSDKVKGLKKERDQIRKKIKDLRRKESEAQKALNKGHQDNVKLHELSESQNGLRKLESKEEQIKKEQNDLDRAKKAASLEDLERALNQRGKDLKGAEKTLSEVRLDLAKAEKEKVQAELSLSSEQKNTPRQDSLRSEAIRLKGLKGKVEKFSGSRLRLKEYEAEAEEIKKNQQTSEKTANKTRKDLETKQKQLALLQRKTDSIEGLRLKFNDAEKKVKSLKDLSALKKEIKINEQTFKTVSDEKQTLEVKQKEVYSRLVSMERLRLEGQAAILAQKLEDGEPCPVCGSPEHPAPAKKHGKIPAEEAIEETRQVLEDIEKERDTKRKEETDLKSTLAKLNTRAESLEETLGPQLKSDIGSLNATLKKCTEDLSDAETAQRQMGKVNTEVKSLTKEKLNSDENIKKFEKQLNAKNGDIQKLSGIIKEIEADLPENIRDSKVLNKILEDTQGRLSQLEKALESAKQAVAKGAERVAACGSALKAAENHYRSISDHFTKQSQEFKKRLEGAGFNNLQDYQAAKLVEEQIATGDHEIQEYYKNLKAAQTRVERAETAARGIIKPDVALLQENADRAKEALEGALKRDTEITGQVGQLEEFKASLDKDKKSIIQLEDRFSIIGRISEVANGKNEFKITFERFVLSSRLDDVLIAASERFRIMTKGRFYLRRQETKGGLELEVFDAYTGTTRPVATLSGGESFLASLSFALGLADVVQSYSGGIYLETIFVDEGFGSLDSEALDAAIQALVDLQKSGRLVGIISHVPELKERIDARLEVTSGKNGSTAHFVLN